MKNTVSSPYQIPSVEGQEQGDPGSSCGRACWRPTDQSRALTCHFSDSQFLSLIGPHFRTQDLGLQLPIGQLYLDDIWDLKINILKLSYLHFFSQPSSPVMAVPSFQVLLDLSVSLTCYKQFCCRSGWHICHALPYHKIMLLLFTSTAGPRNHAVTP